MPESSRDRTAVQPRLGLAGLSDRFPPDMARRSLRTQLNQIRAWVQQGRTDAWIAHQLEVSSSELREFRKQHDLNADGEDTGGAEVDLRDEIEAEVEAATAEEAAEESEDEEEPEEEEGDEEKPARKAGK